MRIAPPLSISADVSRARTPKQRSLADAPAAVSPRLYLSTRQPRFAKRRASPPEPGRDLGRSPCGRYRLAPAHRKKAGGFPGADPAAAPVADVVNYVRHSPHMAGVPCLERKSTTRTIASRAASAEMAADARTRLGSGSAFLLPSAFRNNSSWRGSRRAHQSSSSAPSRRAHQSSSSAPSGSRSSNSSLRAARSRCALSRSDLAISISCSAILISFSITDRGLGSIIRLVSCVYRRRSGIADIAGDRASPRSNYRLLEHGHSRRD